MPVTQTPVTEPARLLDVVAVAEMRAHRRGMSTLLSQPDKGEPMSEKLFSRREWETPPRLASYTGTSPDTIRGAIRRGELEAHRFGTSKRPSYRVSREAWETYLALKSTFKKRDETAKRHRRRERPMIITKEYV